jgi:hypothetical protein
MEVEGKYLLTSLVILLIITIAGLLLLVFQDRKRGQQIGQLQRELEILKQTVSALCSSAVGVDRRVNRVERYSRDLAERQDNIESLHQPDPPYAAAIKMVKGGADADRLVKELGLSEGEADLILMIHGAKTDKELQEE